MRLTGNEVALITAGLATLMALGTIVINRWTTAKTLDTQRQLSRDALDTQRQLNEATLRHQREMAHDERVWAERSAVYVDLIQWLQWFETHALGHLGNPNQPVVPILSDEELKENNVRQARVAAYATDEVKARDHDLRMVLVAMMDLNRQRMDALVPLTMDDPDYRRMFQEISRLKAPLIEQIRAELKLDS